MATLSPRLWEPVSAQTKGIVRISDITEALTRYDADPDLELVYAAYVYSAQVHHGQTRRSGEPYLNHPLWVAFILTQLFVDAETIAAGLLHDTIEDTEATYEDLVTQFGRTVADIVEGVTKLSKLAYRSKERRTAESHRKMLVAMAKDLRVVLVKLADRLHNMRTLESLPEPKRRAIATETLDIYAPIAGRLGIAWVKQELEDLAFRYLEPEAYEQLRREIAESAEERRAYVEEVVAEIEATLAAYRVTAQVSGRPKHLYSIHRKMQRRQVPLDQVYDQIAFRIVVPDLPQVYLALGAVHQRWRQVPGRFKDYISFPKSNGYQSIHTTVVGPKGRPIEIQIRTHEMHRIAELGVAAHWAYKEGSEPADAKEAEAFRWLRELYDWHREYRDASAFVEAVKLDLFRDEVYVFTPRGDTIELPAGATALDFAYRIHTDIGHHAQGAKINGRLVGLDTELRTGDYVEILTNPKQEPRRHWLKIAKTSRARQKIRAYLNRKERKQALATGRQLLRRILRELDLPWERAAGDPRVQRALRELGYRELDQLAQALGFGKVSRERIRKALELESTAQPTGAQVGLGRLPRLPPPLNRFFRREGSGASEIVVEGLDGIEVSLAGCCKPIPGDEIVGYIRVGKGIRIHRVQCPHLALADPERLVAADWGSGATHGRQIQRVTIGVVCQDTPGILAQMGKAIGDLRLNIAETAFRSVSADRSEGTFVVDVHDREELDRVLAALGRIKGVERVWRKR